MFYSFLFAFVGFLPHFFSFAEHQCLLDLQMKIVNSCGKSLKCRHIIRQHPFQTEHQPYHQKKYKTFAVALSKLPGVLRNPRPLPSLLQLNSHLLRAVTTPISPGLLQNHAQCYRCKLLVYRPVPKPSTLVLHRVHASTKTALLLRVQVSSSSE